jgi:hypothetical protein
MTVFASMKGGAVLEHVRDVLLKVVADKRSFLEQSAAVGGAPLIDNELAEVRAIGAAADIVQYAVAAGQEALIKERPPPAWVMGMAAQARTALSALSEGDEQG